MSDVELRSTLVRIIRERTPPPTTAELLKASIALVNIVKTLGDKSDA